MSPRSPVRLYCAGVFAAGLGLTLLAAPDAGFGWSIHQPLKFGVLFVGVLLGEMLPIRIPRRGDDYEELTLSGAFALALLLIGGLGPALVAQTIASVVQDRSSGKPGWRMRFNVGQYIVAMLAAWLAVRSIAVSSRLDILHPISSGQLPAMLVGALIFSLVNRVVVGVAVALYQGVPIRTHFRENVAFGLITATIVLLTAPIVLAAASYSVVIVPLCLAPVVAMYNSISQSARSEQRARHDSLTGLPNRMAFQAAASEVVERPGAFGCVLLLDLDRFKEVNDTLGHSYGDLLLSEVAERIRAAVGDRGEIARLGGDEFALIAAGCTREAAVDFARTVADSLHGPFELQEVVVETQASVGIALFPEHGHGIDALLQKADVAMYRAKETRSNLELYDEHHDHHSPAKLALTAELRAAVPGDEMVVWYQPQLDFSTGRMVDLEALVRWRHPRQGLLLPAEFVRIAEQSNLIKPLTQHVLRCALAQIARWQALGLDPTVAVNISTRVLVDRNFTAQVMLALEEAQVAPPSLKLEVTESALMADPIIARQVLSELDALGVKISIDDFGTGYSSLAYLADLPVSEVKIDRSFVARMATHANEKIIVNSTIDLARHLKMRSVAEGVETPELLGELEALGCDAGQGFAIAHPLPPEEISRLLQAVAGTGGISPAPLELERVS